MRKLPNTELECVLKRLNECNDIKYAAYRTAAKLRILQRTFYLEKLPVEVLGGILIQHHLTFTENAVGLTPFELTNLLEDVYFVLARENSINIDVEHTVDILSRFLIKALHKEDGVELLSVKVVLSLLSGSKPRDKYNYLFSQLADHNSVLTARRLELLLQRLVLLTTFLGESRSFGRALVPGTVRSCFENVPAGSLGITMDGFMSWLTKDPQLLVWISTLHRLNLGDTVVHDVKCSVCKSAPITGLRYRCLRCLSYNQCQSCFFHGQISRNHKRNHPVQEYCYQSTAKQTIRALISTLHNKLRRSGWKLQYLPAEQRDSYLAETTLQLEQLEESTRSLAQGSALSLGELESVIAELEKQSLRLLQGVEGLKPADVKSLLINHRSLVEKQVERLKNVKTQLSRQKRSRIVNSTPCARPIKHQSNMDVISPITSNSLALTWDKYDIDVPEDASCVLTWQEGSGSSSSDTCVPNVSSHAYTWLQNSESCVPESKRALEGNSEQSSKETPEEMEAVHAELDLILDRLQDLLSHHTPNQEPDRDPNEETLFGDVLERL